MEDIWTKKDVPKEGSVENSTHKEFCFPFQTASLKAILKS